ncbi:hypothetical protein ACGF0D_10455 [Kitasatospora sp. NPDC048298]|uniref:hypothetical protein n=1 Tax=Kitasatospora sp. NPDC048298 TaxID=3364049 RepID=UPI00372494A2
MSIIIPYTPPETATPVRDNNDMAAVAGLVAGVLLTAAPIAPSVVREAHLVVDPDAPAWTDAKTSVLLVEIAECDRLLCKVGWDAVVDCGDELELARTVRARLEDRLLAVYGVAPSPAGPDAALNALLNDVIARLALPGRLVFDVDDGFGDWFDDWCWPQPELPAWSPATEALVAEYTARSGGAR